MNRRSSPSTLADEADEQDSDAVVEEEMEVETPAGDSDSDTTDSADSDTESGDDSTEDRSSEEPGTSDSDDQKSEVIKERFPDGSIKIEREVTQDAAGNYLNHGVWKMWDQKGNLVVQGQYRYGNRTGNWIRWYRSVSEAPLLTQAPYKNFRRPVRFAGHVRERQAQRLLDDLRRQAEENQPVAVR